MKTGQPYVPWSKVQYFYFLIVNFVANIKPGDKRWSTYANVHVELMFTGCTQASFTFQSINISITQPINYFVLVCKETLFLRQQPVYTVCRWRRMSQSWWRLRYLDCPVYRCGLLPHRICNVPRCAEQQPSLHSEEWLHNYCTFVFPALVFYP